MSIDNVKKAMRNGRTAVDQVRAELEPNVKSKEMTPGTAVTDVDNVSRGNIGELSTAIANAYYGINYRGYGNPIPINKEQYGLTFFTRPDLRLSYDNCIRHRVLTDLLTTNRWSNQAAVRAWLDPYGQRYLEQHCDLVDSRNPFITILTNNLISLSGFPDPVLDTWTSKPGRKREEFGQVDGSLDIYNRYELQASFRNIDGDPISLLFTVWLRYMSEIFQGHLLPYRRNVLNNRIDYMTRIYRLILDQTRTRVLRIGVANVGFPSAVTIGQFFNFASDKPINQDNDQITVPFTCFGAEYNDPILVDEFNALVFMYNGDLADPTKRVMRYVRLESWERDVYNYRAYPVINPESMTLDLWVEKEVYEKYSPATNQPVAQGQGVII